MNAPVASPTWPCHNEVRRSTGARRRYQRVPVQHSRHSGEEGTVARAELRLPGLPSKHLQLVAKDQDLDVLGAGVAGACNEAGEHADNQVEDEGHSRILRIRRLRANPSFRAPHAPTRAARPSPSSQDCCRPARRSPHSRAPSLERRIGPTGGWPGTANAWAASSVSGPARSTRPSGTGSLWGAKTPIHLSDRPSIGSADALHPLPVRAGAHPSDRMTVPERCQRRPKTDPLSRPHPKTDPFVIIVPQRSPRARDRDRGP